MMRKVKSIYCVELMLQRFMFPWYLNIKHNFQLDDKSRLPDADVDACEIDMVTILIPEYKFKSFATLFFEIYDCLTQR